MSTLKPRERAILEKVFEMESGYVLDFSDRTMEAFFAEEFDIELYDSKYDLDLPSKSKANRLRGILRVEDDALVGNIILKLIEYSETVALTRSDELTQNQKELYQKGKEIGMQFLMTGINSGGNPLVTQLHDKSNLIKEFNQLDASKLDKNVKIYVLKVLFSYYEAAITAYYDHGMFFVSSGIDDLNDYFKLLRRKIIKIIQSDEMFNSIKDSQSYEAILEQIDSLYASSEYLDVVWEDHTQPAIINLREAINDLDLYENGCEIHKVGVGVQHFLDQMTKEVTSLKSTMNSKYQTMFGDEPVSKAKAGSKSEVHHTHTVTFANSAQEKAIELNVNQTPSNEKQKDGYPYTIPDGTRWEDIYLMFTNDDAVHIQVRGTTHHTGFADMGFADGRKNGESNELWVLLRLLAKRGGSLPVSDPDAKDKYKQQKSRLSAALKQYFRIASDPFERYSKEYGYTLRMAVSYPEPPTETTEETLTSETDDLFKSFSQ